MTFILAILAFLLGWKLAATRSAVTGAAASVKGAVHQLVTQASDTAWSLVLHIAEVGAAVLALIFAASWVLGRARRNVTGR